MPIYQAGKGTKVVVVLEDETEVELAIPVYFDGDEIKSDSIYILDVGRKVVFIEHFLDIKNPPLHRGQIVALHVTNGEPNHDYIHIAHGLVDVIGTRSSPKSAVKEFIVVVELPIEPRGEE